MPSNSGLHNNNEYLQSILATVTELPVPPVLTNPGDESKVLSGYEFMNGNWKKVTGTIPTKANSDVTVTRDTVTVPAGYYAATVAKSIPSVANSTATKWTVFKSDLVDKDWPSFENIRYANGLWVGQVSQGGLYYSQDLKTWTASNITTKASDIFGCINNLWIAAQYSLSEGTTVLTSKDGKTWSGTPSPVGIRAIYYEMGIWVLVGLSGIYYSTDNGQTWTLAYNGTTNGFGSLMFANGVWVAGASGATTSGTFGLWYSTDGKTWTMAEGTGNDGFGVLVYENGLWLASNDESSFGTSIYWSEDGKIWTKSSSFTTGRFNSIKYCNGIYVAVSESISTQTADVYQGGVFYSTDGKTWTKALSASAYSLEFAHGVWVLSAANGLYSSTNGRAWTKSDYPRECRWLTNVNGLWYARCYYGSDDVDEYVYSPSFILPD